MASKPNRLVFTYVRPADNENTSSSSHEPLPTDAIHSSSLLPKTSAPLLQSTPDEDESEFSEQVTSKQPLFLQYSDDGGMESSEPIVPTQRTSPLLICVGIILLILFCCTLVFAITRFSDLSFMSPFFKTPPPQLHHDPCPFPPAVAASDAYINCDTCYNLPKPSNPPLPSKYYGDRFMKFDVKGQINNHRESLVIALMLARLTNRTLIIGYRAAHIRSLFDFHTLSQFHPIIADEQMPFNYTAEWGSFGIGSGAPDAQVWYLSQKDYERHPNQSHWITHHKLHSLTNNHFYPQFLLEALGKNSTQWNTKVLSYPYGWGVIRPFFSGFPITLFEGMLDWVMKALLPSNLMLDYANRVLAHLPKNFIAIHWRLGDFLGNPARAVFIPKVDQVFEYLINECGVKPEEHRVVYIATDSPNEALVRNFTALAKETLNLQVVTWANYSHLFSTVWNELDASLVKEPWRVGYIESLILGRSARLVPTPLSSFSEFAFMLMRAYGNREGGTIAERFWTIHTRLTQTALRSDLRPADYKLDMPMSSEAHETLEAFLKPLQ